MLVRYDPQPAGYTILVTDLVSLWKESLDRKGIIRRALNEDTPIDPTEGHDQLKLLLRHLENGLQRNPGTSMKVSSKGNRKEEIQLTTTSPSPPPLNALVWTFHLTLASGTDFSKELTIPLMNSLFTARREVAELLSIISQKDEVLGKINSSLESNGRSMTDFFRESLPRGTPDLQRKALLRKLPGLERLDADEWRDKHPFQSSESVESICNELFRPADHDFECGPVKNLPPKEEWWVDLGPGVDIKFPEPTRAPGALMLHQETSSAGFATQDSPRENGAMPSPPPATKEQRGDNDEIDDSDATASTVSDLDAAPRPPKASGQSSQQPPRKIGSLGRKTATETRSPTPPAKTSKEDIKSPGSGFSADPKPLPRPSIPQETGSKTLLSSAHSTSPPPNKAKNKLGRVGGKKISSAPVEESDPEAPSSSAAATSTSPTKPKKKIGRIGGRTKAPPSPQAVDNPPVSESTNELPQTTQLPSRSGQSQNHKDDEAEETESEDEIEAANRRRAELKRTLEEKKGQKGPKKRKF